MLRPRPLGVLFDNVGLNFGDNTIVASGGGVTDSVTWVRQ